MLSESDLDVMLNEDALTYADLLGNRPLMIQVCYLYNSPEFSSQRVGAF